MEMLLFYMFLAIGISFLCSILESILLSLNMSYISVIEKKRKKTGAILRKLKTDINVSIASILVLNTIANTLGATGVGAEAAKLFGNEFVFYISVFLTLMILFFSEIIPKTIGAVYWKELAPIAAYIISFFIFITYPFLVISQFITKRISEDEKRANIISREELLESTFMSEDEGIIDEKESDVIENVLRLDKTKIKDILTPRSVVFAVDKESTIEDILKCEEVNKFSRIPVFEETIDHVIGTVFTKKIYEKALTDKTIKVDEIRNDVFTINENIPVSYALDLFIKRKEHMFLVEDNYGQTEGIVTLEDCIETLLGLEIMDEVDTTEDMRELAKQKMKKKRGQKWQ